MSDHVGYFPDVMPTVAELAGAADHLPKGLDGLSLAPTLLGRRRTRSGTSTCTGRRRGRSRTSCSRRCGGGTGRRCGTRPAPAWELYDLKADLGEEKNVAAAHPDVLKRIDAICREAHTPERKYGPGPKESAADYVK